MGVKYHFYMMAFPSEILGLMDIYFPLFFGELKRCVFLNTTIYIFVGFTYLMSLVELLKRLIFIYLKLIFPHDTRSYPLFKSFFV